jgi:hypothetical protein
MYDFDFDGFQSEAFFCSQREVIGKGPSDLQSPRPANLHPPSVVFINTVYKGIDTILVQCNCRRVRAVRL